MENRIQILIELLLLLFFLRIIIIGGINFFEIEKKTFSFIYGLEISLLRFKVESEFLF